MKKQPEVGHVMPKILFPDGSIQYLCKNNPTPFDLFARRFMPVFMKKWFKNRMDASQLPDFNLSIVGSVLNYWKQ